MKRLALFGLVMTASILVLFSVQDAFAAISVTNAKLRLVITAGPPGNELVQWDAIIMNVLNPDESELRFDLARADSTVFYRVLIPAGGLATSDGLTYSLTDNAKDQTGLEKFTLIRQADGSWTASLKDVKASISNSNYESVCVQLAVGADSGSQCSPMTRAGNTWVLAD